MIKAELYSDGGGTKDSASGAGAIVRIGKGEKRFVAFLGGATNNEAEIFAALMGFAYLYSLSQEKGEKVSLHWVSDSEYLLKSATAYIHGWQRNGWKTSQKKPVKNQGMWQSYLALTKGFDITPEHVFGHSGHPENEACDSASTWAREFGLIASKQGQDAVDIDSSSLGQDWRFVDGRKYLAMLRAESFEQNDLLKLAEIVTGKAVKAEVQVQPSLFDSASPVVREIDDYLAGLKELLTRLEKSKSSDRQLKALKSDLANLVQKFSVSD